MSEIRKNTAPRNSSIELLRILSMVMIVFHHFAVHGGFVWTSESNLIARLWYNFILMGGKVGVNVFVLISGYYLTRSKDEFFRLSRVFKFWAQVFFYSIVLLGVSWLTGFASFSLTDTVKSLLPITYTKWWFASTYFVLYLFHPFLNKLLCNLSKSSYQKLLILLVVCWSLIPTFTKSAFESNSLVWFATLYAIAGYIRLYGLSPKFTTRFYFVLFLISSLLTYLSSVAFLVLERFSSIFQNTSTYFYGQEKITILAVSLSLFMLFEGLKMPYIKWVNLIGSATFGVYLIHDNPLMRQILWFDLFKNASYQNSLWLIPYSIVVSLAVFLFGVLIDLARQYLLEKPLMMLTTPILDKKRSAPKLLWRLHEFIFGK